MVKNLIQTSITMAEIEDEKSEIGTIVQEIQPGYMLGERPLRIFQH